MVSQTPTEPPRTSGHEEDRWREWADEAADEKPFWIRRWMIFVYVVLGILAAGMVIRNVFESGSSPSDLESKQVFVLHEVPEHGFSIELPTRWVPIDREMNPDEIAPLLEEAGGNADAIQDVLAAAAGQAPGFYARDVLSPNAVAVSRQPINPFLSLDNLEKMIPVVFTETLGAETLTTDRVEVSGIEALRWVGQMAFREQTIETHAFFVTTDDHYFEIYINVVNPDNADRQTVEAIIDTFTIIGGQESDEQGDCPVFEGIVCDGAITDTTGVIENDSTLEAAVAGFVADHGHEIAVVIVNGTADRSVEQFAVDLGDAWGVGDPVLNDGIVVVVDIFSRITTVQHGYGLNDLPADFDEIAAAGNSFFADGDFDGGILAVVGALDEALVKYEQGA